MIRHAQRTGETQVGGVVRRCMHLADETHFTARQTQQFRQQGLVRRGLSIAVQENVLDALNGLGHFLGIDVTGPCYIGIGVLQ